MSKGQILTGSLITFLSVFFFLAFLVNSSELEAKEVDTFYIYTKEVHNPFLNVDNEYTLAVLADNETMNIPYTVKEIKENTVILESKGSYIKGFSKIEVNKFAFNEQLQKHFEFSVK